MPDNLTTISSNNMSFILENQRTPQEMVQFLNDGAMIRSFSYMLEELRPGENAAKMLTDGLTQITGDNRESVAKKVRNWRSGKSLPKDRKLMFQMCFALQLSEEEADRLIARLSDTGIHYRNPEELAYAYALRMGRSWAEAAVLRDKALAVYEASSRRPLPEREEAYTAQIRQDFDEVDTDEKLLAFFEEQGPKLGKLHETAWRKFMELLRLLQNPEETGMLQDADRESLRRKGTVQGLEGYSLGEVMREYMQLHVPVQQRGEGRRTDAVKAKGLDPVRKMVRLYWPSETTLSRMQSRAEDVNRKTLLLLYLATESFDESLSEEDDAWMYEDMEDDPDEMLEIRIEKMNLFLYTYGMNRLDPGNPFDLLLLYAMKTQEDEEALGRMDEVLELLFAESGSVE